MNMFLIKTGWVVSLLVLTATQAFALSPKERAKRLMEEVSVAAEARDESFAKSEAKAKKEISDREEQIKKMKYEVREVSIELQAAPDEEEIPTANETTGKDQEFATVSPDSKMSDQDIKSSKLEAAAQTEKAIEVENPETTPAKLLNEIVDKKSVENELQEYEGLATQDVVVDSEDDVQNQTQNQASNQTQDQSNQVQDSTIEEKVAVEERAPASEKKISKKTKVKVKKTAKFSKKKSKIAKQESQSFEKSAKTSKKSKLKKTKLANNKKNSDSKISKSISNRNVSRAPASVSQK